MWVGSMEGDLTRESPGLLSEPAVSEPTGLLCEPAGLLSDPAGLLCEPLGLLSEPTGLLSEPAGLLSEPAGLLSEAAGLFLDPLQEERDSIPPEFWREITNECSESASGERGERSLPLVGRHNPGFPSWRSWETESTDPEGCTGVVQLPVLML